MAQQNKSEDNESPLRSIPLGELLVSLGYSSGCPNSSKENTADPPSLLPISFEELKRMIPQNKENEIRNSDGKRRKTTVQGNQHKAITFKVPKRVSLNMNSNKGSNSFKKDRVTSIYARNKDILKSSPVKTKTVRKVLFSGAGTSRVSSPGPIICMKSNVPRKSGVPRNKIHKQTPNNINRKSTMINLKSVDKETSIPSTQEVPLKTSSSSIDDFEQQEVMCGLQSPSSARRNLKDLNHLHKLQMKYATLSAELSAVSTEINAVLLRLYSDRTNASNITTGRKVRSPFMQASASAKRISLLKATLLKTVAEGNSTDTAEDETSGRSDLKMSESISMYNALRANFLRTPKVSRRSLEKGDSISTTVQKQCLSLIDTPITSNTKGLDL